MSALRISRPGIVGTTLIYLGPDSPHKSGHTFYLLSEVTASGILNRKSAGYIGGVSSPAVDRAQVNLDNGGVQSPITEVLR